MAQNPQASLFGRYVGELVWKPLDDGRKMELTVPYGFVDPGRLEWPVPAGTKVDGASIPQALWSFVGGPFEGRYRNASVIHDHYCDARTRSWKSTHRVFYNGMRASGVDELQAKLFFTGVWFGGPRWAAPDSVLTVDDQEAVSRYPLEAAGFAEAMRRAIHDSGTEERSFSGVDGHPQELGQTLSVAAALEALETNNPSLESIEATIDAYFDPRKTGGHRTVLQ